jgi:Glycosyl transferase 4-like domain
MRILLTDHVPLRPTLVGSRTFALARGLCAAGHEVRVLSVDCSSEGGEDIPVRRVVCRRDGERADLPFDVPCFTPLVYSRQTFRELSDDELAAYRDAIRQALDEEVTAFDPRIIHCQHIWVGGHLALETGVPYVLSGYADELAALRSEPRYRRLVQEAAENAGRILVASDALRREVLEACGNLEDRVLVVAESFAVEDLVAVYQQVIEERIG